MIESERLLLNQQSWLSHNALLHSWNPFFEIWICKSLSERKKTLTTWAQLTKHCRNHRIRWQKKIDFSYLDPGGTLESKRNDLKLLFSRKPRALRFKRRRENRANLADKNKQQLQRACHVPYMTSQYETKLWSTHVNIVRLAEPISRCVRWRTQVFKIEGAFHSFPSPLFHFFALGLSLLRNRTKWKRLPRRLCTLLQFVLPKHHSHDSLCPQMAGIHPSGEYKPNFVGHHIHLLVCAQNFYDMRDTQVFWGLNLEEMILSPHLKQEWQICIFHLDKKQVKSSFNRVREPW